MKIGEENKIILDRLTQSMATVNNDEQKAFIIRYYLKNKGNEMVKRYFDKFYFRGNVINEVHFDVGEQLEQLMDFVEDDGLKVIMTRTVLKINEPIEEICKLGSANLDKNIDSLMKEIECIHTNNELG